MRIATSQYQSTMSQSLQVNQERISYITRQLASNKRILMPSDDPVDSVRLARLSREEATVQQYRDNISSLQLRMTKSENYLTNMHGEMNEGRDLVVWALNGGNSTDDLQAMLSPLETLRESLMFTGNTLDQEGNYLFSGTATKTAPFIYDATQPAGSRYSFAGNTNPQLVVVGNGVTQAANENLAGLEKLLNELDVSIDTLKQPDVSLDDPVVRDKIKANLVGFDVAMALVMSKVGSLGGNQNIVEAIDANHANVSLANQMAINDIGQLDVALAATQLTGYTNALQATYKAYSRISGMSLFELL